MSSVHRSKCRSCHPALTGRESLAACRFYQFPLSCQQAVNKGAAALGPWLLHAGLVDWGGWSTPAVPLARGGDASCCCTAVAWVALGGGKGQEWGRLGSLPPWELNCHLRCAGWLFWQLWKQNRFKNQGGIGDDGDDYPLLIKWKGRGKGPNWALKHESWKLLPACGAPERIPRGLTWMFLDRL